MKPLLLAAVLMQAPTIEHEGNWEIQSHRDPITDREEVSATITMPEGQLAFMCTRGERSVLAVQPRAFLGGPQGRYELRDTWTRFDAAPAEMTSWKYAGDYATPYSTDAMDALIYRMRSASTLTIRMTSFDRSTVDLTFNLSGADAALTAARARC